MHLIVFVGYVKSAGDRTEVWTFDVEYLKVWYDIEGLLSAFISVKIKKIQKRTFLCLLQVNFDHDKAFYDKVKNNLCLSWNMCLFHGFVAYKSVQNGKLAINQDLVNEICKRHNNVGFQNVCICFCKAIK